MCNYLDKNRVPAWVPPAYISQKDARRKDHLTSHVLNVLFPIKSVFNNYFQDLERIQESAIYGVRQGQAGIFYPPVEIKLGISFYKDQSNYSLNCRTLVLEKQSVNKIDLAMLSEATIIGLVNYLVCMTFITFSFSGNYPRITLTKTSWSMPAAMVSGAQDLATWVE